MGITLIVVISGGFLSWFFFFNQPPTPQDEKPDLTILNYTLENDNLTVTIANIGDSNVENASILVTMGMVSYYAPMIVYYNRVSLAINETFVFIIIFTDFKDDLVSGHLYIVIIELDNGNHIDEISEANNNLSIDYYYEEKIQPLSPNTYCLNSSINKFTYAVQFNSTQILIEDTLNISNGAINGYNLINSTILENSTVSNSDYRIIIALYGNQNLTLRNIWNSQLSIVLNDLSRVSLFNCSIQELVISGNNDIFISNSTLYMISSSLNLTNFANFKIENNSSIEMCLLSTPGAFDIEFSTFKNLYVIISTADLYAQQTNYLVTGTIKNCSIQNLLAYGQTNFDIYGTDLYQVNAMGYTRLNFVQCVITEEYVMQSAISILNNTKVISELSYGIIISSGLVNLVDGQVQGSSYMNNTILINANVSKTVLSNVVVNNTGQAYISNFSSECNLFLYNDANVVVNDTTIGNEYGVYLEGSSNLIGINSSFGFIYSQDDSSIDLSAGSRIESCLLNNSKDIIFDGCFPKEIAWYTTTQTGRRAEIINSTIEEFYAQPSTKVDIINSSIDMLYDAIQFQSGTNFLNSTGLSGSGFVLNNINITNSIISNKTYKYIEITGDTNVMIEDIHDFLTIRIDSGTLTITNCTLDSLQMRNSAVVHLDNCSTPEGFGFSMLMSILSPPSFVCTGNSQLFVNDTTITDGFLLMLTESAQANIRYSEIYGIYILQSSQANITDSEFYIIRVTASSVPGYAANIMNCQIVNLESYGWNYS